MIFKYFEDPKNYAFLNTEKEVCDICGTTKICFDTSSYLGEHSIEAACSECMKSGKLIELDVCGNEVSMNTEKELKPEFNNQDHSNIISYCTPALPTWQEMEWPIKNGDYCKFIKLASKDDFFNKDELFDSIPNDYHFGHDANDFWEMLPSTKITNLNNGNFDTSFYLFISGEEKVVLWDCN